MANEIRDAGLAAWPAGNDDPISRATVRGVFQVIQDEVDGIDGNAASALARTAALVDYPADASIRPGKNPALFTSALTGRPSATAPLTSANVEATDLGEALSWTGEFVVTTRDAVAILSDRAYRVTFAVEAATNPTDPEGDTLRLALRWLNGAYNTVATRVVNDSNLVVADGVVTVSVIISKAGEEGEDGIDILIPPTAHHFRPFVQSFSSSAKRRVHVLAVEDITNATIVTGDVIALTGRVSSAEDAIAIEVARATEADAVHGSAITELDDNAPWRGPHPSRFDRADAYSIDGANNVSSTEQFVQLPYSNRADRRSLKMYDEAGQVTLAQDLPGSVAAPSAEAFIPSSQAGGPARIVSGDIVVTDAAGERTIASGAYDFSSAHPRGPAISAAWNKPSIGAATRVRVAMDGAAIVPDAPELIIALPMLSQSLGVGHLAIPPLVANPYGDAILMGDVGVHSDVRLGQMSSETPPPTAFNPATLVGFKPAEFKVSGNTWSSGQTPLDQLAISLQKRCREQLGFAPRLLPFVHGRTSYTIENLSKGSVLYQSLIDSITKFQALAVAQGRRLFIPALFWQQGESGQTDSNYRTKLLQLHTDLVADVLPIIGQSLAFPLICAQPSSFATGIDLATRQMPIQMLLDPDKITIAGPNYPYQHDADTVHLTALGTVIEGEYLEKALVATMGRTTWKPLHATSATVSGSNLDVVFHVPVPPIALDVVTITERAGTCRGVVYNDSNGDVVPTGAAVLNPTTIRFTLPSAPSGSARKAKIGLLGHTSVTSHVMAEMPRVNIRDSDPATSAHDGRRLYNWAIHQEIGVT